MTTATTTKTPLENVTLRNFYYFGIIPIRSICTLWAKYAGRKMKKSPSCAHVLQKTLNVVILRCFSGDGKEMYKKINTSAK